MPARLRSVAARSVLVAFFVLAGTACSTSDGSDPERTGPTKQAVERLHDYGLTNDEASCIVDEIGADSVVEATDLNALTEGDQYRDAADACIDDA
ncbi:MAG: hypothetical protein JWO77_2651 [Ilumatobacteraceae bacterium]|nr:hypothetical protein [Ilumatobacteraceae bacterium]